MATALKITRIDEFSLVPRIMGNPANEHATIDLTKTDKGGAQVPNESLPASDVQKAIEDALAKAKADFAAASAVKDAELAKATADIAKMHEESELRKCAERLDAQGISKALAADVRTLEKAAPEAAKNLVAELARVTKVATTVSRLTKAIGEGQGESTGHDAKLAKSIADLKKANPALSDAAAYTAAFEALSASEQAALITGGR